MTRGREPARVGSRGWGLLARVALAACTGISSAHAQDLEWINVSAGKDHVAGSPLPTPYHVTVLLDASAVESVQLTPPPGSGLPTMDLVFDTDFHFLWVLDDSVDPWWDAQPVGDPFGAYTFDITYSGGASDQAVVDYSPTTPLVAPAIQSPEHDATDVPVAAPLITWTPGSPGGWFWVELDGAGGDSHSAPNSGQSSWQAPSDLVAGESYELTVGIETQESTQSLTTVGLDGFDFTPGVSVSDDIVFTTTWQDEGRGVSGLNGVTPRLDGHGELQPGEAITVTLSDARPGSTAYWVLGALSPVPFKGGTLIPSLLILFATATGPTGSVQQGAPYPASPPPPGAHVAAQVWVVDPAAILGFSATNGLSGWAPP